MKPQEEGQEPPKLNGIVLDEVVVQSGTKPKKAPIRSAGYIDSSIGIPGIPNGGIPAIPGVGGGVTRNEIGITISQIDYAPLNANLEIVSSAELKNYVSSYNPKESNKNSYDNPFFNNQYFAGETSMRAGYFADIGIKKIVHITLGEYSEEGYKWEYKDYKSKISKFDNHFFEFSIAAGYGISFKYDLKKNRIDSFSLTEYGVGFEFSRKSLYGWQIFVGGSSGGSIGLVLGASFSGKAGWILN